MVTWSLSSILKVILLTVSPTLLRSRITPAPLMAEVWVARGKSESGGELCRNYNWGIVCELYDELGIIISGV